MSGKDLLKLAKKNGWVEDRITGSHHILTKGDKTVSVPIHANKDIGTGLLDRLIKELGLK